jgi:hypothetical protein
MLSTANTAARPFSSHDGALLQPASLVVLHAATEMACALLAHARRCARSAHASYLLKEFPQLAAQGRPLTVLEVRRCRLRCAGN